MTDWDLFADYQESYYEAEKNTKIRERLDSNDATFLEKVTFEPKNILYDENLINIYEIIKDRVSCKVVFDMIVDELSSESDHILFQNDNDEIPNLSRLWNVMNDHHKNATESVILFVLQSYYFVITHKKYWSLIKHFSGNGFAKMNKEVEQIALNEKNQPHS